MKDTITLYDRELKVPATMLWFPNSTKDKHPHILYGTGSMYLWRWNMEFQKPTLHFGLHRTVAALGAAEWRREAKKWATVPVNDCKNFDNIAGWKAEADEQARKWQETFEEVTDELEQLRAQVSRV